MSHQAFQYNNSSIHSATFSWVYILYHTVSKELNIGLSFNLTKQIDSADSVEKLVYYRSFKDPFDAVAHKHLLDSLSKESVLHNIQQENPTLNKLNFEISNK